MQISNKKHVEARTQIWRFVSHASWLQLQDVAFILDNEIRNNVKKCSFM